MDAMDEYPLLFALQTATSRIRIRLSRNLDPFRDTHASLIAALKENETYADRRPNGQPIGKRSHTHTSCHRRMDGQHYIQSITSSLSSVAFYGSILLFFYATHGILGQKPSDFHASF